RNGHRAGTPARRLAQAPGLRRIDVARAFGKEDEADIAGAAGKCRVERGIGLQPAYLYIESHAAHLARNSRRVEEKRVSTPPYPALREPADAKTFQATACISENQPLGNSTLAAGPQGSAVVAVFRHGPRCAPVAQLDRAPDYES